jgi:multidrug resistance protein, MATE family
MSSEQLVDTKVWQAEHASQPGNLSEVALLAYPVVLQTIAETAMHTIDSAMIGTLGSTELGAIGFAGIWIWTLFVPFAGLATGVQVFVSRHHGAGEHALCGPWVWQALWLVVPATIVWVSSVSLFMPALFTWIGPPEDLRASALAYGLARLPAGPTVAANFAMISFFRGLGDTRTPLVASLAGIAVNAISAWLLIFGEFGLPRLGTVGAAIAQGLGSLTIAGFMLFALLRRSTRARYHTRPVWPERSALVRFLRTSAPIGGQWVLDMATFAIFTSIVARMGAASAAASQAMLQLLALSFMQAVAISSAAGTLIGRYLGAGDLDAASRAYRSAHWLALWLSAAVALLFLSVPEQLLGVFSDDPDVLALARPLLALGALFQLVDAIGIVASGSLRGAGDTRWPFAMQATLAWALRLPAVYLGAVVLERGVYGAWLGELAYITVLGIAFLLRFRAGNWRRMRI